MDGSSRAGVTAAAMKCPAPTTPTVSTNANGAGCWIRSRRTSQTSPSNSISAATSSGFAATSRPASSVLDYMLRRDSNGNGLLEMVNNNHTEKKSSDWIDVVWASFENGLVNAEMYNALVLWADRRRSVGRRRHGGEVPQRPPRSSRMPSTARSTAAGCGIRKIAAMSIGATRTVRSTARTPSRP